MHLPTLLLHVSISLHSNKTPATGFSNWFLFSAIGSTCPSDQPVAMSTLSQKTLTSVPETQMRIETFVWLVEVGRLTDFTCLRSLICTTYCFQYIQFLYSQLSRWRNSFYLSSEHFLTLKRPRTSKTSATSKKSARMVRCRGVHQVWFIVTARCLIQCLPCLQVDLIYECRHAWPPLLGHNGANMAFYTHSHYTISNI